MMANTPSPSVDEKMVEPHYRELEPDWRMAQACELASERPPELDIRCRRPVEDQLSAALSFVATEVEIPLD